jgi:hypothetical protein
MDAQLLQQTPERTRQMPRSPAPSRGAPHYARAAWTEDYVAWFISQTPQEGPLPPDISPTHRYEVEFAYCMLDPQRYQRETQEELRKPAFQLPE